MAEALSRVAKASQVAIDSNWQDRVKKELESNRNWKSSWGYLAGSGPKPDSLEQFAQELQGNRKASVLTVSLKHQHGSQDSQPCSPVARGDSIDNFTQSQLMKAANNRKMPQDEFCRPVLNSHTYGWGNNLERFGRLSLPMK